MHCRVYNNIQIQFCFGVNIMRKTEEYNITFSEDNQVVKKKRVKKDKMNVFEVFGAIVGALVTITFVFLFCFRIFEVEGRSTALKCDGPFRSSVISCGGFNC